MLQIVYNKWLKNHLLLGVYVVLVILLLSVFLIQLLACLGFLVEYEKGKTDV